MSLNCIQRIVLGSFLVPGVSVADLQQSTERSGIRTTAPGATIELISSDSIARKSAAGMPYFVSPVSVFPVINAEGHRSGLQFHMERNGVEIPEAAMLQAEGIHELSLVGKDQDGKEAFRQNVLFQIRNRPLYTARVAVQGLEVKQVSRDAVQLHGKFLVASGEFSVRKLASSTLTLSLFNESGQWEKVPAVMEEINEGPDLGKWSGCVNLLDVNVEIAAATLFTPATKLLVTGSGEDGELFDFMSFPFAADEDAIAQTEFATAVGSNDCDPKQPGPPGNIPCTWKYDYLPPGELPPDLCHDTDYYDGWYAEAGYSVYTYADPFEIRGKGIATADGGPISWGLACSSSHGTSTRLEFSGTNCCQNCTIKFNARPSFTATVYLEPNGIASAGGKMTVSVPCGVGQSSTATAEGTISIVNQNPPAVIEPGGGLPLMPVAAQDGSYSISPKGNLSCVYMGCSADLSFTTEVSISTWASTTLLNYHALAEAQVLDSHIFGQWAGEAHCKDGKQGEPVLIQFPNPD